MTDLSLSPSPSVALNIWPDPATDLPGFDPVQATTSVNVVVLLLDDVGIDGLSLYDAENAWPGGFSYASTPTIDGFAATGVRFNRFYAMPVCSPTRSCLLSGMRANRTRVGSAVNSGGPWDYADGLSLSGATTLPTLLQGPYGSQLLARCIGKWHLGLGQTDQASVVEDGGFDRYKGCLTNVPVDGSTDYYNFLKTTHVPPSAPSTSASSGSTFNTVDEETDATAWRTALDNASQAGIPFLLYWPMHVCHGSFDPADNWPPSAYHSYGATPPSPANVIDVFRAYLETADTAFGNWWSGLSADTKARTWVIIAGDNGTDSNVFIDQSATGDPPATYDPAHAKQTTYEQGVRCPLIVSGPGIPASMQGTSTDAICEMTDIYATIAGLLGVDVPSGIDGVSLEAVLNGSASQVRDYVYAHHSQPNGAVAADYTLERRMVLNQSGWKLKYDDGTYELYDLTTDPLETSDRIGEIAGGGDPQTQYADLKAAMDAIRAEDL